MQLTHPMSTLKPRDAPKAQTQMLAETSCPGGEWFPKEGWSNRILLEHSLEQPERSEEPSASETPGPSCHSPSLRFPSPGQWPILTWRSIPYSEVLKEYLAPRGSAGPAPRNRGGGGGSRVRPTSLLTTQSLQSGSRQAIWRVEGGTLSLPPPQAQHYSKNFCTWALRGAAAIPWPHPLPAFSTVTLAFFVPTKARTYHPVGLKHTSLHPFDGSIHHHIRLTSSRQPFQIFHVGAGCLHRSISPTLLELLALTSCLLTRLEAPVG